MPDQNGRVSLREFLDARFDALESRLDEFCTRQDTTNRDVEARLRTLERQSGLKWLAHIGEAVGIVLAAIFGIRQP